VWSKKDNEYYTQEVNKSKMYGEEPSYKRRVGEPLYPPPPPPWVKPPAAGPPPAGSPRNPLQPAIPTPFKTWGGASGTKKKSPSTLEEYMAQKREESRQEVAEAKAAALAYYDSIGVSVLPPIVKGGKLIRDVTPLDSMKQTPKAAQAATTGQMAQPVDPTVPAPPPAQAKGSVKVCLNLPVTKAKPHAPMPTRATPTPERATIAGTPDEVAALRWANDDAPLRSSAAAQTTDDPEGPSTGTSGGRSLRRCSFRANFSSR